MKNAIPGIVIGCIVIAVGVYVATHRKSSLPAPSVQKMSEETKTVRTPLVIETQKKKEIKNGLEYSYETPLIENASNLQIAIDGQIENRNSEFVSMAEEEGENGQQGYNIAHTFEIIRNDEDYVTIAMRTSSFLGGAHGNPSFRVFTYSRATEALMTQQQILETYTGKMSAENIYDAVTKKYGTTDDLLRDINEIKSGIEVTIESSECIGIGKKGIYVRFPVYTLAPYAAGELFVEI